MEESQIMYRRHKAAKNTQDTKHISSGARCVVLASFLLVAIAFPAHAQWTQAWSDEFNGPAGSSPDPTNWTYDVGGGGWATPNWKCTAPQDPILRLAAPLRRTFSWMVTAIWSSAR